LNFEYFIVDGSYLAHRSFHAFQLFNSKGKPTNLIYSFLISLNCYHKKLKPKHTYITWDVKAESQRRKIDGNYKPPKHLHPSYINQVKVLQKILYCLSIPQYYSPGFEADDVIATLCRNKADSTKVIFTIDKDIFQLVNEKTWIFDGKKLIDEKMVIEKFGVEPSLIPYLLAITGDPSDNIEGFKGYGYKKASKVVKQFLQTGELPKDIDTGKFEKNLKLTKLYTCPLQKMSFNFDKKSALVELLDEFELKRIKSKLNEFLEIGDTHEEES